MSRKSYLNEGDKESRQANLIRALSQDNISPQSTEPEKEKTLVSDFCRSAPSAASSTEDQPESPLPPLIIEIEPNKHDEPEEVYQKLEKKIMKIYRRMFIEGRSDVSNLSDSDSTSMIIQNIPNVTDSERANFSVSDSENTSMYSQTDYRHTLQTTADLQAVDILKKYVADSPERSSDSDKTCLIENETKVIGSEIVQRGTNTHNSSSVDNAAKKTSDSSDYDIGYKQVTIQADVLRDAKGQHDQKSDSLIYDHNSEEMIVNDNFDGVNNDGGDSAELEENNVSDNNCSVSTDEFETAESGATEIMTTPRTRTSNGSLLNKRVNELKSFTESESSSEYVSIYEECFDYDNLPTSVIQSENDYESTVLTRKRKTSPSRSVPTKTKKCADISVQPVFEQQYTE